MEDREHLRLVVDAAPIAIVVAGFDGAITLINEQGERLFGYERDELLGRSIETLVPERFRAAHPILRAGYHAAPAPRPMGAGRELYGLRRDGTEVPIEIGLNFIATQNGTSVLASIIDITERKHAEEVRLQRDRAIDASQLKSQFVATMSHELRTPLNAIIGSAELLSETELDERQRNYVEAIDHSAGALLAVISSILDFSKIEAGKIDLDARDFELDTIVEGAAAVLAQQVRDKGLTLHAYVDPMIPPVLRGDQDRLRQILLNLIGNAVKFTDRGRVVVRALPLETSSRHARVRFEVQDTGIGIPAETMPKLFEPFVQGDGSTSRRFSGTGLGLSISKRLVELMDGEIGVTSEEGHGSLFWFTACFGRPTATSPTAHITEGLGEEEAMPPGHQRGPAGRVLIAEDNASLQEILMHQFTQLGISLKLVSDGQEAVDAVRHERFDVVFMDCHMPNMDGFAATRAIRGEERKTGEHLPIVAMTANAFKEDREACIAAGMDDYLSKPVRMRDLATMIQRWIGTGREGVGVNVAAACKPSD